VLKSHSIAATIALLVALGGCGETTAPNKNFSVSVAIDGTPAWNVVDSPNGPVMTCTAGMTVTGHGSGRATWTGASEYYFIGADRSTSVDTSHNAATDLASAFGVTDIGDDESHHTFWIFKFSAPFDVTMSIEYLMPDGRTPNSSGVHFTCGPSVQGAVVPTVTQISVPSMTGQLNVGDTVSVTYAESGSTGIWASIIDITGTFQSEQVLAEKMATSVNRTVKFVVPPNGNAPGVPLTVSVRAFDAALVGSAKSLETHLAFVDRTPPVISQPAGWTGAYAVGDTLMLGANATDDNLLGWLVYQLGAPANARDSVAAIAGRAGEYFSVNIPIRPEWIGSPTLSMYVRDAGGLTSQILTAPAPLVIYPTVDKSTTPVLSLSQNPADDIAYDAKRDLMYVGIPSDNKIAVFSPSTMTAQSSISLPGTPAGMDLSLSGDSLLVAVPSANEIAVVDLTRPTAPPGSIKLTVLDTVASALASMPLLPSGLRIAANGKMLVMLSWPSQANDQVVEVDLTTGAQRVRSDARNLATVYPYWTRYMGRSNDHSRIYSVGPCVAIYDSASDTFQACLGGSGSAYMGMTFDAAGTLLTRGSGVFDQNLQGVYDANVHGVEEYAAISPDGATVYMGGTKEIRSMRLSDKTMLQRMLIPINAERLFVSPSGTWVLAFQSTNGARVTRIDLN
jgi:hypothetical protein